MKPKDVTDLLESAQPVLKLKLPKFIFQDDRRLVWRQSSAGLTSADEGQYSGISCLQVHFQDTSLEMSAQPSVMFSITPPAHTHALLHMIYPRKDSRITEWDWWFSGDHLTMQGTPAPIPGPRSHMPQSSPCATITEPTWPRAHAL